MADDIHLNKGTFADAVKKLNTALQNLEAATSAADTAVQDAIGSVGGSGTAVGGKMDEMCAQANTTEFQAGKASLQNFLDGLGVLDTNVQEVEADMLAQLNAIEGSDGGTSA